MGRKRADRVGAEAEWEALKDTTLSDGPDFLDLELIGEFAPADEKPVRDYDIVSEEAIVW